MIKKYFSTGPSMFNVLNKALITWFGTQFNVLFFRENPQAVAYSAQPLCWSGWKTLFLHHSQGSSTEKWNRTQFNVVKVIYISKVEVRPQGRAHFAEIWCRNPWPLLGTAKHTQCGAVACREYPRLLLFGTYFVYSNVPQAIKNNKLSYIENSTNIVFTLTYQITLNSHIYNSGLTCAKQFCIKQMKFSSRTEMSV